jgi:hypothetical protein
MEQIATLWISKRNRADMKLHISAIDDNFHVSLKNQDIHERSIDAFKGLITPTHQRILKLEYIGLIDSSPASYHRTTGI